jgi:hypothetical protein
VNSDRLSVRQTIKIKAHAQKLKGTALECVDGVDEVMRFQGLWFFSTSQLLSFSTSELPIAYCLLPIAQPSA